MLKTIFDCHINSSPSSLLPFRDLTDAELKRCLPNSVNVRRPEGKYGQQLFPLTTIFMFFVSLLWSFVLLFHISPFLSHPPTSFHPPSLSHPHY